MNEDGPGQNEEGCPRCDAFTMKGASFCGECGKGLDCPHCDSFRTDNSIFCGACGRPFRCPYCAGYADSGADYCGKCGTNLIGDFPQQERKNGNALVKIALSIILLIGALLIFETFALFDGAMSVVWMLEDSNGIRLSIYVPIGRFFNEFIVIAVLKGNAALAYWAIVVAAIAISAFMVFKDLIMNLGRTVRERNERHMESSALFWISMSLSIYLLFSLAYSLLLLMLGMEITVPGGIGDGLSSDRFQFANAAFWEEIADRVLYIGAPLAAITLIATKNLKSLKCLIGGVEMSKVAVILIFTSALIFALAHQVNWSFEKVPPVMFGGLLFGYLFIRFGLFACITFHFIVDYLTSFAWYGFETMEALVFLIIAAYGIISLIYLISKGTKKRIDWKGMPWVVKMDSEDDALNQSKGF